MSITWKITRAMVIKEVKLGCTFGGQGRVHIRGNFCCEQLLWLGAALLDNMIKFEKVQLLCDNEKVVQSSVACSCMMSASWLVDHPAQDDEQSLEMVYCCLNILRQL
jgi:hypothetical protein